MAAKFDAARELERLCGQRADEFLGSRSLCPRHLWLLARIAALLTSTTKVRLQPGAGPEGDIIRTWLDRRSFGYRSILHQAASSLRICPGVDPLEGPALSTLRRMDRKAKKLGITCRRIDDVDERSRLLEKAIEFEKAHPDTRYRHHAPETADLLSVGLWLIALSADGEALALSVTPVSGDVGLLRYFRTLTSAPEATLARYALTAELLRRLSREGVDYLVDNRWPIGVGSALRHFATMVGFRIVRAELHR